MLKWLTITLIAVVVFVTLLLGLGYLLKEHEAETTQLKHQLDQTRAEKKAKEERRKSKKTLNSIIETSLIEVVDKTTKYRRKSRPSLKQKILIKNLTCASTKQCVLVDIKFSDLTCTFAINTIGASLLAKTGNDLSSVGKCPSYPRNSQLSCLNNLCSYGNINK
jgi:flagellar biosynthesis component FlhA